MNLIWAMSGRGVPLMRIWRSRSSFNFASVPRLALKFATPVCTVPITTSGCGVPTSCQSITLTPFSRFLIALAAALNFTDPRPLGCFAIGDLLWIVMVALVHEHVVTRWAHHTTYYIKRQAHLTARSR
ncbi:hypothetical protein NSND_50029 [Nitrospira sp. ND1]|nr:hypothetical protein NSND_50029 [Nitrospira sp. ND1]